MGKFWNILPLSDPGYNSIPVKDTDVKYEK